MITEKLKSLLNGGAAKAGVDGLQREIDLLKQSMVELREEATAIPARRAELLLFVENDGALDELDARENTIYRSIDRITMQVAALEGRLAEQRNLRRNVRIEFHQKELRKRQAALDEALEQTIAVNETAIRAYEAALAEIGERDGAGLFPRIGFGALLSRDGLEFWRKSLEEPKPSAPRAKHYVQPIVPPMAGANGRVSINDAAYVPGARKRTPRAALPDAVPAGHSRVIVLRGGYEGPNGEQLSSGDELDLPVEKAYGAARAGAVEIKQGGV